MTVEFGPGRTLLLGPNGAGKSTLLRLLGGLLRPTGGRILLDGEPVLARSLQQLVGFMPREIAGLAGLTVFESVRYAAWLAGLPKRSALAAAKEAVAAVGLWDKRDAKSTDLSGGQLRRMGLASVLAGTPSVLLLDEPTAGLDPAQRHRFRDVLLGLPDDLIVVVSTHQVDDVDDSYHQVRVLADGELRWKGTPQEAMAPVPHRPRASLHASTPTN